MSSKSARRHLHGGTPVTASHTFSLRNPPGFCRCLNPENALSRQPTQLPCQCKFNVNQEIEYLKGMPVLGEDQERPSERSQRVLVQEQNPSIRVCDEHSTDDTDSAKGNGNQGGAAPMRR